MTALNLIHSAVAAVAPPTSAYCNHTAPTQTITYISPDKENLEILNIMSLLEVSAEVAEEIRHIMKDFNVNLDRANKMYEMFHEYGYYEYEDVNEDFDKLCSYDELVKSYIASYTEFAAEFPEYQWTEEEIKIDAKCEAYNDVFGRVGIFADEEDYDDDDDEDEEED